MKILVLGYDGYIGYPLTLHLIKLGHEVSGIDNESRRERVKDIGSNSLTAIDSAITRRSYIKSFNVFSDLQFAKADLHGNPYYIKQALSILKPDCIVHLAEQPSAPWSMIDPFTASKTQYENIIGTLNLLWTMKEECPNAHLVKIGTMGEYGTPNCDIPEGLIPKLCLDNVEYKLSNLQSGIEELVCPMSGLLFPRQPGSFYHLSKVHDTYNIKFACDTWGLRSTDIMQGVLFGVSVTGNEPEIELTRFDYDEYFGTVINRFCVQAVIGHPLTVYGKGYQQRGFLPLKDSIQCLTIAINNPPAKGEYRTWNQFEHIYSINKLAEIVYRCAKDLGFNISISHIKNPRVELDDHYYNPHHRTLLDLGYIPTSDIESEIKELIHTISQYKDRIIKEVIMPKTTWR